MSMMSLIQYFKFVNKIVINILYKFLFTSSFIIQNGTTQFSFDNKNKTQKLHSEVFSLS